MEGDDNSDEDIGKPNLGLSYDSDEKNDEEIVDSGNGSSELIDLGNDKKNINYANIPRLSGPK